MRTSAPATRRWTFRFRCLAPDGDVSEPTPVAQRDLAFGVDAVAADAVVGGRLERLGACFETCVEGFYRGSSAEGAVRSEVVVVVAEAVQLELQRSEGFSRRLLAEVELEGLVQAARRWR